VTDDLDRLKEDPGVIRLYKHYVPSLKRAGSLLTGCCPLHADSSPSFSVYPDLRWTCFSGPDCGSGNIFQLIERIDGVSFQEAVEKVKKELGEPDSWSQDKARVESTFKPVTENKTYKTLPLSKADEIGSSLLQSPEAVHYLDSRGITLETAKKFKLGFRQTVNWQDSKAADILDKGWLLFPYIDGEVVRQVKFRSLERKKPGGFQRSPGMETVLFNVDTVDPFEPVYLTSGEFDAIVLEQAGFHAVSLMSDSHKPTPAQKDQLMAASMVILAGDSDTSGVGIMDKLWKELGNRCYKLTWPEGMKDANQTWLEYSKRDPQHFRTTVEELTQKAKSQPLPDIYSIQEVMQHGEDTSLADRPDRLRFPWSEVDRAAVLLPGSVLGVLATSTSMGKTAMTLQFSLFGARKYNEVVVNWQCELSPSEISVMVAAQVLHKNRNFLTKEDLKEAARQLDGVQYYIGNNPTINNINDVLDIMEAAIRRTGATVAVLDNAHFYTSGVDDDVRVLAAALKRMKQIAVAYGVKFVVVFQPRKASQQARGKRTHISDVKGSASAGDTCDAVVAIHRELSKGEGEEAKNDIYEEKTLVEWLKTRSKGTGKASSYLQFFGEFAEFQAIENNYPEVPDAPTN
jgi:hypothetical protein